VKEGGKGLNYMADHLNPFGNSIPSQPIWKRRDLTKYDSIMKSAEITGRDVTVGNNMSWHGCEDSLSGGSERRPMNNGGVMTDQHILQS